MSYVRAGEDQPHVRRIDRNWTELLQELRVAQTGVQILAVGTAAAWVAAGVLAGLPLALWTVLPWSVIRRS